MGNEENKILTEEELKKSRSARGYQENDTRNDGGDGENSSVGGVATTTTPPQPSTTFQDFYEGFNKNKLKTKSQIQKAQTKEKRQKRMAALIDGISALGNVYFASQGANATGTTNISGAVGDKWSKYWDDAKRARDEYDKGMSNAFMMDYNANVRKMERAEDKAERENVRAEAKKAEEQKRQDNLAALQAQADRWQKEFGAKMSQNLAQQEIQNKQLKLAQQTEARLAGAQRDKSANEKVLTDAKVKVYEAQAGKHLHNGDKPFVIGGEVYYVPKDSWATEYPNIIEDLLADEEFKKVMNADSSLRAKLIMLKTKGNAKDIENFLLQHLPQSPKAQERIKTLHAKFNESPQQGEATLGWGKKKTQEETTELDW